MKAFLRLVEIKTKVASVFPFLYGVLYALYFFKTFDLLKTLLFFGSLICIDMATTAINNWMDYKRDTIKEGYHYEVHNAIVYHQMPIKDVRHIVFSLLGVGVGLGLVLVYFTDYWVLCIGVMSFLVGILYSSGPFPISRTPLGEVFSGLFMGFVIFFVSVYVQINQPHWFGFQLIEQFVVFKVALFQLLNVFFWSLPFVFGIASIMLANNIADRQEDIKNRRETLPILIGHQWSVKILYGLYGMSLIQNCVIYSQSPVWTWLALMVYWLIFKNLKQFCENPSKEKTFILVVKSYVLLAIVHIMVLALMILLT